jgi:hypothetical protein
MIHTLHLVHLILDDQLLTLQAQELLLQLLRLGLKLLLSRYQVHVLLLDSCFLIFDMCLLLPYLLHLLNYVLVHLIQLHLVAQSSVVHDGHLAQRVGLLAGVDIRILLLHMSHLLVGVLDVLVHIDVMLLLASTYLLDVL